MSEFSYQHSVYDDLRKRNRLRWVVIVGLSIVWVGLNIYRDWDQLQVDSFRALTTIGLSILVTVGILFFSDQRRKKRIRAIIESFSLLIEGNTLVRQQANTPEFRCTASEIESIQHLSNGQIRVRIKGKARGLIISKHVGPQQQLLEELQSLHELEEKRNTLFERYPGILSVLTSAMLIGFWVSQTTVLLLAFGLPLVALMVWSFIEIRVNPNFDHRSRNVSWIVLAVAILILGRIFMALELIRIEWPW